MATEPKIKISESGLYLLKTKAVTGSPDLVTPHGELFLGDMVPIAGIKLKDMSLERYLKYVDEVPEPKRVPPRYIVPTGDPEIPVVVNTRVLVKQKKTYLGDQEVILLL